MSVEFLILELLLAPLTVWIFFMFYSKIFFYRIFGKANTHILVLPFVSTNIRKPPNNKTALVGQNIRGLLVIEYFRVGYC